MRCVLRSWSPPRELLFVQSGSCPRFPARGVALTASASWPSGGPAQAAKSLFCLLFEQRQAGFEMFGRAVLECQPVACLEGIHDAGVLPVIGLAESGLA